MNNYIQQILRLVGLAQIVLALGSLAIPQVLKWRAELAKVQPLIKQMFWTYAAYIFVINLCFGLISLFDFDELSNSSHLSILLTAFIAVYWISRVLIQFFYFDRSNFPSGKWNHFAEIVLVTLFVCLSVVYSWVCYANLNHV